MKYDRICLVNQQMDLSTGVTFMVDDTAVGSDQKFILSSVLGLEATEILVSWNSSVRMGSSPRGGRPVNRQPVINFKMNPDYSGGETASDLREYLYRLFADPSAFVYLMVCDGDPSVDPDNVVASLAGVVSKIDTPSYAKDLYGQITIDSNWPYLIGPSEYSRDLSVGTFDIVYTGTAPAPFNVSLTFDTAKTDLLFSVEHDVYGTKQLEFLYNFQSLDVLFYNDDGMKRSSRVVRSFVSTNLMGNTSGEPLLLYPGTNHVEVNSPPGSDIFVTWRNQFRGV